MFTIENKKSEKITIRQHPNMQPFEMIKNVEDDELDSPQISLIKESPIKKYFQCKNKSFRVGSLIFCIMILIITLLSIFLTKSETSPNQPVLIKSPKNDPRKYYSYQMSNGLNVLLILDKECVNPGGALSVNVGSKQDGEINGIAHLLEHLLFMGSEKYPIEDYFFSKVAILNGYTNAYTANEATVYYWSIKTSNDSSQYDEVLDIWSSSLKHPLINSEKISREMNAVHSEYLNSINNPDFRFEYSLQLMMNPISANSKFSCGNLDSFTKKSGNITRDVFSFFKKYYSPNNYNLVLLGNFSLEELKKKSDFLFDNIQISSKKSINKIMNENTYPDDGGYWKGKFAKIKQAAANDLVIAWILPEMLSKYRINPLEYWTDILNSEHENGLVWGLKTDGLIEKLKARTYAYELDLSIFLINFQLTEEGFKKIDQILIKMREYFDLIKENITRERWEELKNLRDLAFNYENKNDDIDDLSNLAFYMRYMNQGTMTDIFNFKGNIFSEYNDKEIINIANFLLIEKSLIISFNENYYLNQTSVPKLKEKNLKYFNDYSLQNYSELHKIQWDYSEWSDEELKSFLNSIEKKEKNKYLVLPGKNLFIPNDLSLPCKNREFCEDLEVESDSKTFPKLIKETKNHKVWYKMQRNFNKLDPKALFHFRIISPFVNQDSRSKFFGYLARRWLKWNFTPLFQQLKDLGFIIKSTFINNIELKIFGFADKMDKISAELGNIVNKCSQPNYIRENSKIFDLVKNQTIKKIRKEIQKDAIYQATEHLKILISNQNYNFSEMASFSDIKIEEFINVFQDFIKKNFLDCLIVGALEEQKALNIWNSFALNSESFNSETLENLPQTKTIKLSSIKKNDFIVFGSSETQTSSAFILYYEIGVNDVEKFCKIMVLAEYFNNKAFDFLRTKAQLGYIAGAKNIVINGIMGLMIFVQGPANNFSIFEEKIEEFLMYFYTNMDELSQNEFILMIESKINDLTLVSKLEDKEEEYWKIIEGNLTNKWDIKQKLADFLKDINKADVLNYWKQILNERNNKNTLKVIVLSPEVNMKEKYQNLITNYSEIKNGGEFYEEIQERINFY